MSSLYGRGPLAKMADHNLPKTPSSEDGLHVHELVYKFQSNEETGRTDSQNDLANNSTTLVHAMHLQFARNTRQCCRHVGDLERHLQTMQRNLHKNNSPQRWQFPSGMAIEKNTFNSTLTAYREDTVHITNACTFATNLKPTRMEHAKMPNSKSC